MTEHGPAVRVPPPVLVAAILGAGWAMRRLLPVPFGAPMPGFGLAVIGMGLALAGWAVLAMLRAGTDPRPDRPDNALLEGGPFRFTRNPIYLGFVLVAAGLALRWGDLWSWLAVAATFLVLDRFVVAREEDYLRSRFGAAYSGYARRVRRWV